MQQASGDQPTKELRELQETVFDPLLRTLEDHLRFLYYNKLKETSSRFLFEPVHFMGVRRYRIANKLGVDMWFTVDQGVSSFHLVVYELSQDEKTHFSRQTTTVDRSLPFVELEKRLKRYLERSLMVLP